MTAGAAAQESQQHLSFSGLDRTYRIYRPANVNMDRPAPLVLVLHGGFGSGLQAERDYGWDEAAARHGFVVAYPDGISRSWNAGTCCGPAMRRNVDDVGFLTRLIEGVSKTQNIDTKEIAVTGMSNGAMMAYRMACESGLPLRGIGSVSGTMLVDCVHPARTNVMEIHGLADQNIPFEGGRGMGPSHVVTPPIPDVVAHWRSIDSCGKPQISVKGPATTAAASCANGRRVELITIAGAGHQWPGGVPPNPETAALAERFGIHGLDQPSRALDATETLSRFFFGNR